MRVGIAQLDGRLPNLAVMKLASWHRSKGDSVIVSRGPESVPSDIDLCYGSTIFSYSSPLVDRLKARFPEAIVGGTGTLSPLTVEQHIGSEWETYDYADYPDFPFSLGFTQRGCRLKCSFCVVPWKEGKPRSTATINQIWRGAPYPKKICLLDNDFFGQPREEWQTRIAEIQEGNFRVCLNQGINVRLINEESAAALASIQYRDDQFQRRCLYTAWDNIGDEKRFFTGVDMLQQAGIPPKHLMAYMLIGFDIAETWERIFHRFNRMVSLGIRPYPMVYDAKRKDLKHFQRWVVTGLYRAVPWSEYRPWILYQEKQNAHLSNLPGSQRDIRLV